jgi:hypothetical protein
MRLTLNFYVERPLHEREQMDALESLITLHLPVWATKLRVAADEDSPASEVGLDGSLCGAAREAAPAEFGLSSIVISGSYEDLLFFVDGCDSTLPPELNRFSVEVVDRSTIEGRPLAEWARDFFAAVPAELPVRYANGWSSDEFDAKNLIMSPEVVKAVGVQIDRAVPGLYWLNYFGAPYVSLVGRQRLLSSPGHQVQAVASGVLIGLGSRPNDWNGQRYEQRERHVIAHLGEQYFFSKHDPEKDTRAPDFRSQR